MLSERDRLAARERRDWIAAEDKRVRDSEDHAEYSKYKKELRGSGIEPLSFDEWRKHIPAELKDADPRLRGVAASTKAHLQRLARVAVDRVKSAAMTDEELVFLGFDVENRMYFPELLSAPGIAMAFEHFAKQDSRCDLKLHFHAMGDFLTRNNLFPSDDHIRLAFCHLHDLHLLPEPQPELEPNPELNSYGVNLGIARDEALEAKLAAQKRREEYGTKKIYRGPDGSEYTQYEIDHVLTADESLRVMRFMEGR